MHNQAMTMDGPRLKQPRFNTKKKLMIYIALAATYLIVVMVAGLVMDPEMYGVHYEDGFWRRLWHIPLGLISWDGICSGEA